MSFSSPAWLLLLLFVPLVIILHALSIRWRSLPASSLVFWNEVLRERKASLRIRRLLTSLVLALQVLAVTALAVALAGPLIAGFGRTGSRDVILVLDATASMQTREGARTRFDIARERGLARAAGLRGGARMAVVLAEKSPRLLSAFTGDAAALRRAIQAAVPTDEPGDVAQSMLFAMSLRDPRRDGQVVLETDGAFDELPGVDVSLPWVLVDVVGTARDNVGITRMAFRRAPGSVGGYQLFLAVRNAGRAPVVVPLAVSAGGREVVRRTLAIEPGQQSAVTLPWTGPTSGTIDAVLWTGDSFPLDDHASAVFAPARGLQVLCVGPRAWFVRQALAALPGVTVRTSEGTPTAAGADVPHADVTVYVGVQPPALEHGNFIIFDAVPPNLPIAAVGSLRVPPVTGWSRTDPLLSSVSLAGVTIGQALDLQPGPGFSILAASGTSPLMLGWDHSGVKALIVAFDPQASDFPLRPGFPVLLANALSWFFPTWLQAQADQVQAGDAHALPGGRRHGSEAGRTPGERCRRNLLVPRYRGDRHLQGGGRRGDERVRREPPERFGNECYAAVLQPRGASRGNRGPAGSAIAGLACRCRGCAGVSPAGMACVGVAPGERRRGMSIQDPLWLIVLALLPPLAIFTFRQVRRRSELLSPGRTTAFLILRVAAVVCLVLGLAGFAFARLSDRLSIVFLLDQSRSVTAEQRERALQVIDTIRGKLGRGDSAALVRFGGSAQSEPLEPGVPVPAEGSDVDPGATNIGAALQDGLAQAGSECRAANRPAH